MALEFRREYLITMPLPLAQLYSRAHNAKDGRGRHDNSFYLFESLIKLSGAPLVAAYHEEIKQGCERSENLDRLLIQLALPSLGQFVGILRETARYFGERDDADTHPMGHIWGQLNDKRKDLPGMIELFRRIKNGPEGKKAGDKSCTIIQLLDALVTYRNAVIGHGAGRVQSFYEEEMAPLMFPAVNDIFSDGVWDMLGPKDSRLVLLESAEAVNGHAQVEVRELAGLQSERSSPIELDASIAEDFRADQMAVLWPGRKEPLFLDPLMVYRENEIAEDVQFLNRDRNRKQAEYLSYATGETTRDKKMSPPLNAFLDLIGEKLAKERAEQAALQKGKEEEAAKPAYDLLAELGRGGMGVVYLARQTSLGRLVALKMLPEELQKNEVAVLRFKREMRALGHCEHPNIVKVIACGQMPTGELYYAMEYVPGTDLEQLWMETAGSSDKSIMDLTSAAWAGAITQASTKMREQTAERTRAGLASNAGLDPEKKADEKSSDDAEAKDEKKSDEKSDDSNKEESIQTAIPKIDDVDILPAIPEFRAPDDDKGGFAHRVAAMIRDAALALQCVHDQGLVHRDIKPANLMLTPDGERVVLMDFGLAKDENAETSEASASAGFLGTLRYSAPEQLDSATKKVGAQADIRGLGVTMWELLTRQKLFDDCQDEGQLTRAVYERDVPLLRSIDPNFDRDIEAIVARATERNAEDRLESAAELVTCLDLYLDGKPIPIRTPGLAEMFWRWVKAHKALVGTIAGSTVTVVTVFIVAFILITIAHQNEKIARIAEEEAKVEATERFIDARNAIDESLTGVSEALQFFPGVGSVRERLLRKSAEDYRRFARQKSDNPDLKAEAGKAWVRLGNVHGMLLEWEEARDAYTQAEDALLALLKDVPDSADFQMELANSRQKKAGALTALGEIDTAESVFAKAVGDLKKLNAQHPEHVETANTLAVAMVSRSELQRRTNRHEDAEEGLRESLKIFQTLATEQKEDRFRNAVAQTTNSIGRVQALRGENAAAVETLAKADEAYQALVVENPENPDYLFGLASCRITTANAMRPLGRTAEVVLAYEKAINAYELLIEARPDQPRYEFNKAVANTNLGQLLFQEGRAPEAKEQLFAALQHLIDLTAQYPGNDRFDEQHANVLTSIGRVLSELTEDEFAQNAFDQAMDAYGALIERASTDDVGTGAERYIEGQAICVSNYAQLKHRLGDLDGALADFEAVIALFNTLLERTPDDPFVIDGAALVLTHYAHALAASGDSETAATLWEQAIALREQITEQPKYVARLAWLLANVPSDALRRPADAVDFAQAAVEMDATNAGFLNTLGAAQFRNGQLTEAIETLKLAAAARTAPDPFDGFFSAAALWMTEDEAAKQKAIEELTAAATAMQERRPGNLKLIRLRQEVADLMGVEITEPAPEQTTPEENSPQPDADDQ